MKTQTTAQQNQNRIILARGNLLKMTGLKEHYTKLVERYPYAYSEHLESTTKRFVAAVINYNTALSDGAPHLTVPEGEFCSYHETKLEPLFQEQMVGDVSTDVIVGYECPHCRQEYELSRAGQPQEITDFEGEIPF